MLRINSHMKLAPSTAPPYAAPTPLTAAAFCAKRKRAPCKRPSSAHRPTGSEVVKESKAVARAQRSCSRPATVTAGKRLFHSLSGALAGIDAQQRIRRAHAEQAGGQRHDADPAPQADGAAQAQANQNQADGDAQAAVDGANVGFHDDLQI